MGLDFSHSHAHWSYGGFSSFRHRLADAIGDKSLEDYWREQDSTSHPIAPLLNHSDCDGELTPEELTTVEPALRALVEKWPADDWDRLQALQLCKGMRQCIADNTPLIFC